MQVVSILHMVFDFLAFKNDIAFWKENKRSGSQRFLSSPPLFVIPSVLVILQPGGSECAVHRPELHLPGHHHAVSVSFSSRLVVVVLTLPPAALFQI